MKGAGRQHRLGGRAHGSRPSPPPGSSYEDKGSKVTGVLSGPQRPAHLWYGRHQPCANTPSPPDLCPRTQNHLGSDPQKGGWPEAPCLTCAPSPHRSCLRSHSEAALKGQTLGIPVQSFLPSLT